jgi:hypothetical protein
MKQTYFLPTWAPRIKPYRIRQLYESDALGLPDPTLLDDVGWALHSRCESFLQANAARQGQVICPSCGSILLRDQDPYCDLRCSCGWVCPPRVYFDSIRNQQLDGGPEVQALFQQYVDQFPKAKEPDEKMLLVDNLIHGFHHFLKSGRTRRPVAVNLIDGHLDFVIDFLDRLSYGPESTPGLSETHTAWREKVHR